MRSFKHGAGRALNIEWPPSPRTRSRTVTAPAVSGDLLPPGLGLSAAAPHLAGRLLSARVAPGAVFPEVLSGL